MRLHFYRPEVGKPILCAAVYKDHPGYAEAWQPIAESVAS